jgi:hypothetical protein
MTSLNMNDNRRYHVIIEQQVDIFIEACKKVIEQKGLTKIWVTKDEETSMVYIGDPDKASFNKDAGFTFYYEMIVNRLDDAMTEFIFKLNHFIKVARSTDRYKVFKNDKK